MALAHTDLKLPAEPHTTSDISAATVAVALGVTVAYLAPRPYWDDAGATAFALLAFAAFLGFLVPRSVWLWAIGIGIWIPAAAFYAAPSLASASMLIVLGFSFAGAYGGRYLRLRMDEGRTEDE